MVKSSDSRQQVSIQHSEMMKVCLCYLNVEGLYKPDTGAQQYFYYHHRWYLLRFQEKN